jgi:polar amino acid transport system substrate-binding protein
MWRVSSAIKLLIGLILVVGVGGACRAESSQPVEGITATVPPTATNQPLDRGNPFETPIPAPVETSALEAIRERGTLRVGTLFNHAPLCYLADNGEVKGYEPALIQRIAEQWGVEVEFVQVTRQTRLPMLLDGEVDVLAAAMPHRRELEQFVEFSDTTFRSGYVVLVKIDQGIGELASLGGSTVGVIGDEAEQAFAEAVERANISPTIERFDRVEDAVSAFGEPGRVDALVGRREDMMLVASSVEGVEILNEFVAVEPYALAVQRGDIALRDMLDIALQQIATGGDYGQLFQANFYGYPADLFPEMAGEPALTFETMPTVLAQDESVLDRIKRGEAIRVAGMALSSEPEVFDSQPIIDGYNRAVINEMSRRWNVPVSEIPDSAGQAGLDRLAVGQADLVVGVKPDRSMIGRFALSDPYYQKGIRLIYMHENTILGVADLELKPSMIVEPLDISRDLIEDNNGIPRIQEAESFDDAFQSLLQLSVQAVVGDEYALMLMKQTDERIEVVDTLYRPTNYVMALPDNDPDFLALVSFTLQDMKADGTLDTLREQYFGPYLPEEVELEPLQIDIWPGDGSYLGVATGS